MQFDFKKMRTDVLAIVVFLVVSIGFCLPQFQGKKLKSNDHVQWQCMAQEGMAYHDSTGKDVLWSNSMFGGMPSYTYYIGAKNNNYTVYVQDVLEAIGKPAYFFFIAMLCFYLLMRVLGINKWLGVVGAVAVAFSSYNSIIIAVGHETKMLAIAYIPLVIAGIILIYREKWLNGALLFALGIALMATSGHYQIIYYTGIILLCFVIGAFVTAIKTGKIKEFFIASVIAAVTGLIGLGPAMSGFLTTNEYTAATMRGGASELAGHDKKTNGGLDKDYAFSWSNGVGETFSLMIPYLYGGGDREPASKAPKVAEAIGSEEVPLYWGPQPSISGPVYFGAIVCFLFVLGLMVVRSPNKWWILAASVIAIVLSWGKNFDSVNYFLFDHIPMLNKFRTVSMALTIAQVLFPLLGIWAIQEIIDQKDNKAKLLKDLKIAAGITAGLCLVVGVGSSMFFSFTGGEDAAYHLSGEILKTFKDERASLAVSSGLKSAVLILIAAGLIWAFITDKVKPVVLIAGMGLLIVIDLVPVSYDYLNDANYVDASEYDNSFVPRNVDKQILRDPDPYYRVLDLTQNPYNDAMQAYFHKCVGGYSPTKMEVYQDLIDRHLSRGFNGAVLNMLNTKYIIAGGQKSAPGVIPNPKACGNAWFVDEVKWANTAEEEITALNAPGIQDTVQMPGAFDPKKTAVMRATFKNDMGNYTFGKDSSAYVKLDKYGLDDISFKSSNSKDGLAVFSDMYYAKGWKALVDGKETPIMKVDYVMRAIKVPAGSHSIEFHFHPDSFYHGQKVAFISSILLILLGLGALAQVAMKKDKRVA